MGSDITWHPFPLRLRQKLNPPIEADVYTSYSKFDIPNQQKQMHVYFEVYFHQDSIYSESR